MTELGCIACDKLREREGTLQLIGRPCDICGGAGWDYLGRLCRHDHQPLPPNDGTGT